MKSRAHQVDGVTLREYRADDWEAMYALDVECFAVEFRFTRRTMRSLAEARNAATVLAVAEDRLVGFCIMQMEKNVGYVVTLDVASSWRRRGLAGRLVAEMEARAQAKGGAGMALHVFRGNGGAVQFYESMGYGRAGVEEGFYGRGLDAFVYRKRFQE